MKIKIGETAHATLVVDIAYRCSSCGKDNKVTTTMTEQAYTSTVMGFNIDRDVSGTAKDALYERFFASLDESNPHRFRTAGLSCICGYCMHKEPWAKMKYDHLENPQKISIGILMISVIVLFFGLGQLSFNIVHGIAAVLAVLSAAVLWCIDRYIAKNNEEQERLIASLPVESLPTISVSIHKRPLKY